MKTYATVWNHQMHKINTAHAIAAILMGGVVLLHVIGGGAEVHLPTQAAGLTPTLKAFAAVLWHAVTVALIVFTAALAWISFRPNQPLALTLIAIQLGWTGLFIYYGLTQLGTLAIMPQWVIFTVLPTLIAFGSWHTARKK
jgi:hypothetical protein